MSDYTINDKQFPHVFDGRLFFTLNIKGIDGKKKAKFPKKWTDIIFPIYNKDNNGVALLTGEKNDLFVVDYDDKLNFKIDSALYPELLNYYEESRKGFHCYFSWNKNTEKLGSRNIKKHNIDFLGSGKCVYSYPTEYVMEGQLGTIVELISDKKLTEMTDGLYDFLNKKYIKEILPVSPPIHHGEEEEEEKAQEPQEEEGEEEGEGAEVLQEIKIILDEEYKNNWKWSLLKITEGKYEGCYNIFNNNDKCLCGNFTHKGNPKHSNLFVSKGKIIAKCWSHDEKKMENLEASKKIREILGLIKKKEKKVKVSAEELNPYQLLLFHLLDDGEKNKYKKENGFIYKPLPNVPTHYEQYLTYREYVNTLYQDRSSSLYFIYRKNSKMLKQLIEYLEEYNDIELPNITRSRYHYSYLNGVYNIRENKFCKWGEHDKDIISYIFINGEFNEDWLSCKKFSEISTPSFNKLIKAHMTGTEYKYFLMMLGRLFFEVNELDNWQIMPFIQGQGNTGKGTLLNFLSKLFSKVGTISSKNEKVFGLQTLYTQHVIFAPDLPKNIHEIIDASILQSIISGENVSVPIKNKDPYDGLWRTPMIWAGNYLPSYEDSAGSITRRFAIFNMTNDIKDKDTQLHKKLVVERGAVLVKLIRAYHHYVKKIGSVAFEKWQETFNINFFFEKTSDFKQESNLLYRFISGDPDETKTNNSHIIISYKEGHITPLEKFKKYYSYYLKYKHQVKKFRWSTTSDEAILKKQNYIVDRKPVCLVCYDKTDKCSPCDKKNRRYKKIIINMKIIDKSKSYDSDEDEVECLF